MTSLGSVASPIFGTPSTDLQMNVYYMNQAESHARNYPNDLQAQRQLAYWREVVQRQMAAQAMAAPAAPAFMGAGQPQPTGQMPTFGASPQAPSAPQGLVFPSAVQGLTE